MQLIARCQTFNSTPAQSPAYYKPHGEQTYAATVNPQSTFPSQDCSASELAIMIGFEYNETPCPVPYCRGKEYSIRDSLRGYLKRMKM